MLGDISKAEDIYVVCGYTDMRKSIDGLASMVKGTLGMDPFAPSLFLFCGKRRDRLKALYWEGDFIQEIGEWKLPMAPYGTTSETSFSTGIPVAYGGIKD